MLQGSLVWKNTHHGHCDTLLDGGHCTEGYCMHMNNTELPLHVWTKRYHLIVGVAWTGAPLRLTTLGLIEIAIT